MNTLIIDRRIVIERVVTIPVPGSAPSPTPLSIQIITLALAVAIFGLAMGVLAQAGGLSQLVSYGLPLMVSLGSVCLGGLAFIAEVCYET